MTDWLDDSVREEGENLFSPHPTGEELVLFHEDPDELGSDRRDAITRHLRVCGDCAEDMARLESAGRELAETPRALVAAGGPFLSRLRAAVAEPRVWVPAMLAAAVLLLLLWPDPEESILRPVGRAVVLRVETERGSHPTVSPDVEGRVTLSFTLPGTAQGPVERCDASILDAQGNPLAQIHSLEAFDEFGSFLLSLDAGELADGDYRLLARDSLGETRFDFELLRLRD